MVKLEKITDGWLWLAGWPGGWVGGWMMGRGQER